MVRGCNARSPKGSGSAASPDFASLRLCVRSYLVQQPGSEGSHGDTEWGPLTLALSPGRGEGKEGFVVLVLGSWFLVLSSKAVGSWQLLVAKSTSLPALIQILLRTLLCCS